MIKQSECDFTDRFKKTKDLKWAVIHYLKKEKQQPGLSRPQHMCGVKFVLPLWEFSFRYAHAFENFHNGRTNFTQLWLEICFPVVGVLISMCAFV